jgi:hypothetical protein
MHLNTRRLEGRCARRKLIDFLAAPSAAPVYKANGMEPDIRPTTSG